jgi:hypothetical protein
MAVLPSSLALISIPDGGLITAADHRNNYTSIQTENNALLTILGAGTTGDVFSGVGTTVQFAKPPGYEYARTQITSNVVVSGTSGAQTTVIGPTASVTFDGATAVDIVVFAPSATPGATDTIICVLYEDATDIGAPAQISTNIGQINGSLRRTPAAGAHTYTAKAYRTTNNGTWTAGLGGAGNFAPSFLKIVKA